MAVFTAMNAETKMHDPCDDLAANNIPSQRKAEPQNTREGAKSLDCQMFPNFAIRTNKDLQALIFPAPVDTFCIAQTVVCAQFQSYALFSMGLPAGGSGQHELDPLRGLLAAHGVL